MESTGLSLRWCRCGGTNRRVLIDQGLNLRGTVNDYTVKWFDSCLWSGIFRVAQGSRRGDGRGESDPRRCDRTKEKELLRFIQGRGPGNLNDEREEPY